jgi:hypothetical protein
MRKIGAMGVREWAASGSPIEDMGGGGDRKDQWCGILVVLITQLCLHEQ